MRIIVRLGLASIVVISATVAFIACGSDDDDSDTNKAKDSGTISDAPVGTGTPDSACASVTAPTCGNSACTTMLGAPATCVDNACVKLEGISTCTSTYGAVDDDNAFLFTVLLPQTGDNAADTIPNINALELAVDEINATGGVPVSTNACTPKRKLGFVWCDEEDVDPDSGISPTAVFVTTKLKFPLIVGASTSGTTISLAKNPIMPSKTMMFSPSATSPLLTHPETNPDPTENYDASPDGVRLFWRTAASDAVSAVAVHAIYNEEVGPLTSGVRLAFLNKADAYGEGMIPGITTNLQVNGATPTPWAVNLDGGTDPDGGTASGDYYHHQFNVNLGTGPTLADGGTGPDPELGQIVVDLKAFAPTHIIMVGTDESVALLDAYESALDAVDAGQAARPQWILVDGQEDSTIFPVVSKHPGLAGRIRGEVPGVPSQLQSDFYVRFKGEFDASDPTAYGSTQSYDIGYAIAYALAATATSDGGAVTGDKLATGMKSIVGGATSIDFSPSGLSTGFSTLISGGKIDINGTSGPLQFDTTIGEAPSDYSIWCLKPDNGAYVFDTTTGETYSSKMGSLVGTFSCPQ